MASSLLHVRAAQLRARAIRWALGKVALGTAFLVGAIAHALASERQETDSVGWMAGLLVLSALNVALGLRGIARVRRRSPTVWIAATAAWAVLSTVLVGFLLRR